MSNDEINRGLRKMQDSGKLDGVTTRAAMEQPLEGEKIVRLERIEEETKRQSLALFGDLHLPGGVNAGLVKDVRGLKLVIFKAVWSICGVVAFCTGSLSILAVIIEYVGKR